MDGLIGDTGFVGKILDAQHDFSARFNSRTIDQAAHRDFDTLVCAAAPGSMFEANRFPEIDRQRIDDLIVRLGTIRAKRCVLISTVATLSGFAAEDEATRSFETEIPYGVHRRRLECFVEQHFANHLVVRMPALFGPGLKKNFLFDILNPVPSMLAEAKLAELRSRIDAGLAGHLADLYRWREELGLHVLDREALDRSDLRGAVEAAVKAAGMAAVQFTHPDSRFQYYDMRGLWADIGRGMAAGIPVLHLAPTPIAAGDIYRSITGETMPDNAARVHREDMRTGHAELWNRSGPYIADPHDILAALRGFMREARAAA